MPYEVLARKWRPQKFAEIIGQEHMSRTLQNAIERQRVGHAYLFVGPRGTGKTTSARIFAKALNCESPDTSAESGVEPCCQCNTCLEIAAGNCLDVLEIDGASNNSVDNIRDLRETVQYTPTNGRKYKIYIIDEVHMLSISAWNALLKTLEEPPPHVKFFFATTEGHKVLPTVLSRCQRFDLKRLAVPLIVGRLKEIAASENVAIGDAALNVIGRAAEGGMRDGQSILDQIIAFCGGDDPSAPISENDVAEVFGLVSSAELRGVALALLQNNPPQLVAGLHHMADRGRDLERLYADLLLFLRNVMVCQIANGPEQVLDLSASEAAEMAELAAAHPVQVVQRLVEGMLQSDGRIRLTLNKRIFLESTMLRVMRDAHAASIDDLVSRLRQLHDQGELPQLDQAPPATPAPVAPPPAPVAPPPPPEPVAVAPPAPVALPLEPAPPPVARQTPEEPPSLPPTTAGVETAESAEPYGDKPASPDGGRAPEAAPAAAPDGDEPVSKGEVWRELEQRPIVQDVCDLFDGQIIDVRGE